MDRSELWNLFIGGIALIIGFSLVETNVVAAICLLGYGLLGVLRGFNKQLQGIADEHPQKFSGVQLLLLIVGLIALYL